MVRWFGAWPSFHDAEIMSLHIDRESGVSSLCIRVFTLTDRTDESGRFIRERDAQVVFEFSGIRSVRLEGEDADRQNVISSLLIEQLDGAYRLFLAPCYGMAGEMVVKDLKVRLEKTFQP